jgi:hypothetical protein
MAQDYTRQSTFADGDTITAALFNDEYNQLVNAFAYSSTNASATGHRHDGTSGQGGNIPQIGDLDFNNKIVVDDTNNRWGFFVEVSSAAVEQIRVQDGAIVPVTTNDIDLGTASLKFKDIYIDGTATLDAISTSGTITFGSLSDGSITITAFVDEDDMVSNSATLVPTQQSVKAYVDAQLTAQDLDFQGDTGGALSIDLDSETLTVAGGTGIDTAGATNTLTISIDSTVATLTGTQTLTNKTLTSPIISTISNTGTITLPTSTDTLVGRATTDTLTNKTLTSPVLNTGVTGTAVLDDDTFATASATTLATSESIKAYVDAQVDTADTLAELTDTNITTPADGAVLFYDTATSKWIDNVVSGDITIADTGVAAIGAGVIVNADINASAAISVSKTALVAGTGLTLSTDTLSVDASQTQITSVGALNAGSITSGFGAIDNGASAITTTGTVTFGNLADGTITITGFVDEDNMVSDSATLIPTQQSVKAYVDSQVGGSSGTVTSVAMTVPTGLTISGSPITTSGTLAVAYDTGYAIPTTAKQTQWDTAYGWGDHSVAGYLTSYTETDPVVGAITGIVKADGAGNISAAVAGTDYLASYTETDTLDSVTGRGATTTNDISVGDITADQSLTLANGAKVTISTGNSAFTDFLGGSTDNTSDDGLFAFYGGRAYNQGAGVVLYGDDHASNPNVISFRNTTYVERLAINADGTASFKNGVQENQNAVTSSAGALTVDCTNGNVFSLALSENVTSTTFSNPPSSGTAFGFSLFVTQDATARTITWPAAVAWPSATAPTLSTTSGDVDIFTFTTFNGGTTWYGIVSGQAL